MKSYLEISDVGISFETEQGSFEALSRVNLRIEKGEFVSLIGHSGCGKSTVLNLVAGLLEPTLGGIILDGREVAGPGPERAMVFQNHALLPWLSVQQNVALAVGQVIGAGVVTLVDAVNGAATLDAHAEAVKQAAVADRLVLTKRSLADALLPSTVFSSTVLPATPV